MCGPLLLVHLGIFAGDIILMVNLSDRIGGLLTVILTVVTAAVGISAVREQGALALARLQRSQLEQQKTPEPAVVAEGVLLAVAGIYLLIPGFITDGLGALLLLPPIRRAVAAWLGSRMGPPPGAGGPGGPGGPGGGGGGGPRQIIVVEPVDRE